MDDTDNKINIVLLIICLSNVHFISKRFTLNKYFCEMGKINDNGRIHMKKNHKWYDHIQEDKSFVTNNTNLNLKDIICQNKVRPNWTF